MATIVKLPDSTIRQIAAGEVITSPANVVKELVENSLDAGATNVRVIIEDGGLKLIEIIDNGSGIALADAELLCQQHSTSKLVHAADLNRIETFGFRGEALASVSQCADLQVSSFNMFTDKKGWRCKYKNGEICGKPEEKYLQNPGTSIKVTNLFSMNKSRKMSMLSYDGKKSITELIIRLALHNRERVTMTLMEANSNDLVCLLAPMDIKPCLGMFYGLDMENNMIEFTVKKDDNFLLDAHVVFSHKRANTSFNQPIIILFVNDRLVVNEDLKKELLAVVLEYLNARQTTFFFYVTIKVPPDTVDVNTHPAKATVSLHYHVEIVSLMVARLRSKLQESQSSQLITPLPMKRPLETQEVSKILSQNSHASQSLNPQVDTSMINEKRVRIMAPGSLDNLSNTQQDTTKPTPSPAKRPFDLIHTDSSQTNLHRILLPKSGRRTIKLRSVHQLRELVMEETTKDGARVIKDSVFVGLFDHYRALIQHETKLYAINFRAFLKEQLYQFYLFDFGNFPPIKILAPGNNISFSINMHLDDMRERNQEAFDKLKLKTAQDVIAALNKHAEMYADYFNLRFKGDRILSIPAIIPEHIPNLVFLGRFLIKLANDVDYSDERSCLHKIGRLFSDFYSEPPSNLKNLNVQKDYHDFVIRKLYPALKSYLLVPEWLFRKENICQISDTKDLYKVFERC